MEALGSIGFTRSGQGAWPTVDLLAGGTAPGPDKCPVGAGAVASRLLQGGRFAGPMCK